MPSALVLPEERPGGVGSVCSFDSVGRRWFLEEADVSIGIMLEAVGEAFVDNGIVM